MRCILGLLVLLLWTNDTLAQKYPVLEYTTREGLSQMQVMCTFRDSRGYLWIGTKYGFCKFNGESFERFAPDFKVVGEVVVGFFEDSKGYLYINSANYIITRFDGQRFERIKNDRKEYQSFCIDEKDHVFCIDGMGMLHTIVNDSLVAAQWPSLKNRKLGNLTYDKPTHTLIGSIDSIGLVKITKKRLIPFKDLLPNRSIAGDVWLRARQGQAVIERRFENEKMEYLSHSDVAGWQPFLAIDKGQCEVLRTVPFDWFFCIQNETYLLEANSKKYVQVFGERFMYPSYIAHTPQGTWIGTEKGLIFVVQNGIKYFPDNEVFNPWSVVEDAQQRMWFLNYMHPIQRYDGQQLGTVTGYDTEMIRQQQRAKVSNIIQNQDQWYYGALRDKRGSIWLPNAHGILWHDGQRFEFIVRPSPSMPSSITFSLLEDPARNVVLQGSQDVVHIYENKPPFRTT